MEKFVEWTKSQRDRAKFVWTIVLLVGALFGYELTATQMVDESAPASEHVEARLESIENMLYEVVDKNVQQTRQENQDFKEQYREFEIRKSTSER